MTLKKLCLKILVYFKCLISSQQSIGMSVVCVVCGYIRISEVTGQLVYILKYVGLYVQISPYVE